MSTCNVFWGSHGCDLNPDHGKQHVCLDCCDGFDDEHMAVHEASDGSEYGADGCAGTWPYYGHGSMSGPDAKLPFFTFEGNEIVNLPDEFERLAALRSAA